MIPITLLREEKLVHVSRAPTMAGLLEAEYRSRGVTRFGRYLRGQLFAGVGARATWTYLNSHLVDLLGKCFSHMANTTRGRTANTGSFIDSRSSFIVDKSNLYFRW